MAQPTSKEKIMRKKKFLKAGKLRAGLKRFSKGAVTLSITLMLVAVPTAAHAEGLTDYMPTGPDFATLGPLAPIIVGFLAIILAIVGVCGILAAGIAGVNFGIGAIGNNERKTASAVHQLKMAGIAVAFSFGGAVLMLLVLNLIIGFVGIL